MVAAKHAKPDVVDFLLQSAVLYTPDMKIKWNYNKRTARPPPPTRYMYTIADISACTVFEVHVHACIPALSFMVSSTDIL